MAIWLDSADAEEAREAERLRFIGGITTNPTLLAAAGGDPRGAIDAILATFSGPVCWQITTLDGSAAEHEARRMAALAPGRVILKIPARFDLIALGARLAADGIPWAMTACFSPAQAALGCAAGARYIIPYVNRATRLLGDGLAMTGSIATMCHSIGTGAEVLAASLKSSDEAASALLAGAAIVSAPLAIIRDMGEHELSGQAIEEFRRSTTVR